MNIKLLDVVFYNKNGQPHSAPVLSIVTVENAHDNWASTKQQKAVFQPMGPSGKLYFTVHGIVTPEEIQHVEPGPGLVIKTP